MPRPYHTQWALSQRTPCSSPSSPSYTASSHAELEPSGDLAAHPGPATQDSPSSASASIQPLEVVRTPGWGPKSVLDEMQSFLLPDDSQADVSITAWMPGKYAPVMRAPRISGLAHPALPASLSVSLQAGESQAWGLQAFSLPGGCCLGKNCAGDLGTPNAPSVVSQGSALGSFPLWLLDAVTVLVHPPTAPDSRVTGPSVPSCSALLLVPRTLGVALCPCLSAQILSVETQLSASYFKTPSPIQQLLILSLRHSFKHCLKPFRGQKLCQALGYRDQSDPGSAFESFSEQ